MKVLATMLCLLAAPALAVEAHYEAYAAGVPVLDLHARFDVQQDRYSVALDSRTVGAFSLVMRSQQHSAVEGRFVGARPVPSRFTSTGVLRGGPRVTEIDYQAGQPVVRQLVPPNEAEREPVAPAQQANTVDTLSAAAELIHQVNATGRCEGQVHTFDGRRLSVLEARTSGEQVLEPTGRSSFAGKTLRCEFVGRQLGGFILDEDKDRLSRPQQGTAWFAAVEPGGPMIPVRIAFRTRWFGDATMYLVGKPG